KFLGGGGGGDRVKASPMGMGRFVCGCEDFFVVAGGVLREPIAPGGAVGLVDFLMDGEMCLALGGVNGVMLPQAINLATGDFVHLRFVGVECRDGFSYRAIADNFT